MLLLKKVDVTNGQGWPFVKALMPVEAKQS